MRRCREGGGGGGGGERETHTHETKRPTYCYYTDPHVDRLKSD